MAENCFKCNDEGKSVPATHSYPSSYNSEPHYVCDRHAKWIRKVAPEKNPQPMKRKHD